jgi:TonB family protein
MRSTSVWSCLNEVFKNAVLVLVLGGIGFVPTLRSQMPDQGPDRKLISRVEPHYPVTLERLYIGGVVRIEIVILPTGIVQSARLLGGSPILGQSAIAAVKQWRYAPASTKSTCVVRLEFDPHR